MFQFISVLRFATSRCYIGVGMETQYYGFRYAIFDTSKYDFVK